MSQFQVDCFETNLNRSAFLHTSFWLLRCSLGSIFQVTKFLIIHNVLFEIYKFFSFFVFFIYSIFIYSKSVFIFRRVTIKSINSKIKKKNQNFIKKCEIIFNLKWFYDKILQHFLKNRPFPTDADHNTVISYILLPYLNNC